MSPETDLWAIAPGGAGHIVRVSPYLGGFLSTDCGIAVDVTPTPACRPCKRCQLARCPLGGYQLYQPSVASPGAVVDLDAVLT